MCHRFLVTGYGGFNNATEPVGNRKIVQWGYSSREARLEPDKFLSVPERILTASQHLGQQFNELREGIKAIPDENIRQQSEQALNAILSEVQKTLETDIRVEFVRKYLIENYQTTSSTIDRINLQNIKNGSFAFRINDLRTGQGSPTGMIDLPSKITTASPHLQEISELKKVYLENDDFEKVCKRWDTGHSLHYIDSPYYGKEDYYQEKFTKECHLRLCQMAHELEGQVIISYYPHEDILAMYSENDWEFHYKETVVSSAGITKNSKTRTRPKRTELLLVRKSRNSERKIVDLGGQISLF